MPDPVAPTSTPRPTYYRAGRTRRVALGIGLAVAAAVGGGAALVGAGVVGDDTGDPAPEDIVLAGGEVIPAIDRSDDPPDAVPAERSFDSVVVVGDSITEGSQEELRYVLTAQGFREVTVEGRASRRIEVGNGTSEPLNGIAELYGLLAAGAAPDVWVVALGTNDVGLYDDAEDYRRLVTTVVEMLPDEVPLVWVDVFRPQYLDATEEFNAIVREVLAERGDAAVASWFELASPDDETVLQRDRIHPDDDGQVAFATVVAEAIASLA